MALTKNELMARIASILATLAETNGAPESTLYLFFDMDMNVYQSVRNILVQSKLVTIRNNFVTLTPSGKVTADKLNLALQQKVTQRHG